MEGFVSRKYDLLGTTLWKKVIFAKNLDTKFYHLSGKLLTKMKLRRRHSGSLINHCSQFQYLTKLNCIPISVCREKWHFHTEKRLLKQGSLWRNVLWEDLNIFSGDAASTVSDCNLRWSYVLRIWLLPIIGIITWYSVAKGLYFFYFFFFFRKLNRCILFAWIISVVCCKQFKLLCVVEFCCIIFF